MTGRVVVITGASSGFGKGVSLALAAEGASLVLAARRGEPLDRLIADCASQGGRAIAVPTDVSEPGEMGRLAESAVKVFRRIDVWVNSAGVGARGRFERIPLSVQAQLIETGLMGTLYGSYFAYRQFLAQGTGVLINIFSDPGRHSEPCCAAYGAAKHGVIALSDSLRQEIQQSGIKGVHVCTVLPTDDTPSFGNGASYAGHEDHAPTPLHYPQDLAEAIVRLARDPQDKNIVGADGRVKILMNPARTVS